MRFFSLFKVAIQGYFHVHMYYNPNWFIPSIFLLSALVLFLRWFQQILKFYIHSWIESPSAIFTFFTSFLGQVSALVYSWPSYKRTQGRQEVVHWCGGRARQMLRLCWTAGHAQGGPGLKGPGWNHVAVIQVLQTGSRACHEDLNLCLEEHV
jgi:hypothetical protein